MEESNVIRAPLVLWTRLQGLAACCALMLTAGCATLGQTPDTKAEAPSPASVTAQPAPASSATQDGAQAAPAPSTAPVVATAPTGRVGLDSLNPEQTIRFDEPDAKRDLWQRIRVGYGIPDLQNPELMQGSQQWYATRPDYVQRMTTLLSTSDAAHQ